MGFIPDSFASNIRTLPKTFIINKTLSCIPVSSGVSVNDTQFFFFKNCPFDLQILNVSATIKTIDGVQFNNIGGSVSVSVHTSKTVDKSPGLVVSPVWDIAVPSTESKNTHVNNIAFSAPYDTLTTLYHKYALVPINGSIKAILNAQINDLYSGSGSKVEVDVTIEFLPKSLKAELTF